MPDERRLNRVVVVDDHVLFAEALRVALQFEGYDVERLDLDDHGLSSGQLASRIMRHRPAIVLLDLELGRGGDTTELVAPLSQAGLVVVIVTASTDGTRVYRASDHHQMGGTIDPGFEATTARFSHNGRRIVTSSDDGTTSLWRAAGDHGYVDNVGEARSG